MPASSDVPQIPTAIGPHPADTGRGDWVILVYSPLSSYDVGSIAIAKGLAERWHVWLNVGVVPPIDFSDIGEWCPACASEMASPIWVFIKGNQIFHIHRGYLQADRLQSRAAAVYGNEYEPDEIGIQDPRRMVGVRTSRP
jgi:hypothetical protein